MFPILKFGREQLARLASDHNYAAKPGIIKTTVVKDGEKTDLIDDALDEKQKHAQKMHTTHSLTWYQFWL